MKSNSTEAQHTVEDEKLQKEAEDSFKELFQGFGTNRDQLFYINGYKEASRLSASPSPVSAQKEEVYLMVDSDIKEGDYCVCNFNNAALKFWDELAGKILKVSIVQAIKATPNKLKFENVYPEETFYANSFTKVVPYGRFPKEEASEQRWVIEKQYQTRIEQDAAKIEQLQAEISRLQQKEVQIASDAWDACIKWNLRVANVYENQPPDKDQYLSQFKEQTKNENI